MKTAVMKTLVLPWEPFFGRTLPLQEGGEERAEAQATDGRLSCTLTPWR